MDEGREPEDRIEHIVREAEQGAHFEFNPAAWSVMEQKLDELQPVPFSLWKILFPLAGVAVILMVLLWPISAQDRLRAETNSQTTLVEETAPTAEESKSDTKSTESGQTNPSQEQTARTENNAQTDTSDNLPQQNANELLAQSGEGERSTNSDEIGSDEPVAERRNISRARSVTPVERITLGTEETAAGGGGLIPAEEEIGMLSLFWNPIPLTFPQPELVFEVDSSNFREGEPEPEPDYFEKSKWAFSALVSLDLSATGLDGFTNPGTMFGLGVEYYIARSWSIQSGAALSVKKYTALGSEYENLDWPSGRTDNLIEVAANCLVIDIPINIRKYFYTKNGKTFFASTGVSSYLMLREDYDYEYTEPRPNWAPQSSVRNENQHYLGILNFSLGYETPIGKNLALGIEPFMKLPLTGIGDGRVRFLSFGTNLAIKLRK